MATTVVATGLGEEERDRLGDVEPCASFRPRAPDVRRYFERAKRLSRVQFLHETDWSACHAVGRLRLSDGRTATWRLRRGGSAAVTVGSRTVWFDCESCRDRIEAPRAADPEKRPVAAACRSDEEVLFECPSRGHRIAVCASAGWTADTGHIELRFGSARGPEITLPAHRSRPKDAVAVGILGFSGGGADIAAFGAGDLVYTVYSAIGARWGLRSGVAVDRNGERVSVHRCDRGREGEFAGGLTTSSALRRADERFRLPP